MPRIENEKSIEEGVDNKGFSDTTLSNPEKVSVVDNGKELRPLGQTNIQLV